MQYYELRNFIANDYLNAIEEGDCDEVFRQFKFGFSIDISEITVRVAKKISKQLDVKVPKDLFDVADPCIPFTLDSTMLFRTRLALKENADISNKNISAKSELLRKTLSDKLHNGDFDDIIGSSHVTKSSKSGKTYPVLAISDVFVSNTYMYIDWYVIMDEKGIESFEFSLKH